MKTTTRRQFLTTSALAAGFPFLDTSKSATHPVGANERLRMAVAGVNGRGGSHPGGFMG